MRRGGSDIRPSCGGRRRAGLQHQGVDRTTELPRTISMVDEVICEGCHFPPPGRDPDVQIPVAGGHSAAVNQSIGPRRHDGGDQHTRWAHENERDPMLSAWQDSVVQQPPSRWHRQLIGGPLLQPSLFPQYLGFRTRTSTAENHQEGEGADHRNNEGNDEPER